MKKPNLKDVVKPTNQNLPNKGALIGYKKVYTDGNRVGREVILTLYIPKEAKRLQPNKDTCKCRADKVYVLSAEYSNSKDKVIEKTFFPWSISYKFTWELNKWHEQKVDRVDNDCGPGLHFWLTKKRAKNWS